MLAYSSLSQTINSFIIRKQGLAIHILFFFKKRRFIFYLEFQRASLKDSVMTNFLPMKIGIRRGMTTNADCQRCNDQVEFIMHFLKDCMLFRNFGKSRLS